MALATARHDERRLFALDEKEIREHEFVAQTLISKLSDLGMVIEEIATSLIWSLDPLSNAHQGRALPIRRNSTLMEITSDPGSWIPPRTRESCDSCMSGVNGWGARLSLGRRLVYGAMEIAWWLSAWWRDGDDFMLPSGCGVIHESRLVNEWRELALKRGAVRDLFFGS